MTSSLNSEEVTDWCNAIGLTKCQADKNGTEPPPDQLRVNYKNEVEFNLYSRIINKSRVTPGSASTAPIKISLTISNIKQRRCKRQASAYARKLTYIPGHVRCQPNVAIHIQDLKDSASQKIKMSGPPNSQIIPFF